MSEGTRRTLFTILIFGLINLLGGCNVTVNLEGGGKVLLIHDDADISKRTIESCPDVCKDSSIDGFVMLHAVPDEGYTFLGYTYTGIATSGKSERNEATAKFGLDFNTGTVVNTHVTAVFHPSDDILDFQESNRYFCMLSKSEGLQCWFKAGNKRVRIDSDKVPAINSFADQISVGDSQICAINGGELNCWGDAAPDFSQIQNPIKVSSKYTQTCVIADSGVACWDQTGFLNNIPDNIVNPREIQVRSDTCVLADSGLHCWWGDDRVAKPDYSSAHGLAMGGTLSGCALDGNIVRCWGAQAPLASTQPSDLMNPSQLAVLGSNACVLDDNGVKCWGDNSAYNMVPPLTHPTKVEVVDVYDYFFCALDDNGTSCWGGDYYRGQARNTPDNLVNPVQVVAGDVHTCALDDNGVSCWGGRDGHYGALVPPLAHPTMLSVDGDRTCALDGDDIICWNYDGVTVDNHLSNIRLMDIDYYLQNCAVNDTGMHCWNNAFYDDFDFAIPNITQLAATSDISCVITENPTQPSALQCWLNKTLETIGPNTQMQWGSWDLPTSNVTSLVTPNIAGWDQSLCVLSGQSSECFGYQYVLEEVNPSADELALGYDFRCKILNGVTSCSGKGQAYEEGLSNRHQSAPPAGLTATAHSLTAGAYHACAIDQGKVICWGEGPVTKLY